MKQHNLYRCLAVPCLVLLMSACVATPPVARELSSLSRAELLSGKVLGLTAQDVISAAPTLAVNDDMRAFLAQHVPEGVSDERKVALILSAILERGLELRYNNFRTLTAEEAFYQREGNCLSFTNLFVALAREAGVRANFQEVDVPPSWTLQGDTYLYNLHVNVLVNMANREQVIDFDITSYNKRYHRRVISDQTALAQYHNNMAVYWLSENEIELAFPHLQFALDVRPHTAYFWTNLGSLYRRGGKLEEAEAAFLVAVDIDNDPTAMSNLSRLYQQLGEPQLAQYYADKTELFRARNPYYLFRLAEKAYAQKDYAQTEKLLEKAIRYRKDEHEFYRLLGLSYLQHGERAKAQRRFKQAAELVDEPAQRERYNHKLHLLADS